MDHQNRKLGLNSQTTAVESEDPTADADEVITTADVPT